ncbi:hypothetical protein MMC13_000802 [Lambiella insularis]|nr:hypothetical protein [Lambiella insularis]
MAKRKSITGLKRKRKRSVAPVKQNDGRESALDASSGSHSITTATQSPLENLRTDRVARAEPARIGSKRSRIEVEDDVDLSYYQLHKDLVLLKPRLRYIHQDVIKRNWRVLPEAVQSRVRELLVAVQRPVICRHREGKSREEAQEALNTVTRTLAKRLPRMPFPMKTKEEHFDYERLLNKNLSLEHQLTPAIHSIALLEGQIVKEEALLAKETIALQELNRNARAEETLRNRLATKVHPSPLEDQV